MKTKHPMQPLVWDKGVVRFKRNRIVKLLLEAGPFDMNKLPAIKSLKVDVDMNRKLWAAASELAAEVKPVSVVLA